MSVKLVAIYAAPLSPVIGEIVSMRHAIALPVNSIRKYCAAAPVGWLAMDSVRVRDLQRFSAQHPESMEMIAIFKVCGVKIFVEVADEINTALCQCEDTVSVVTEYDCMIRMRYHSVVNFLEVAGRKLNVASANQMVSGLVISQKIIPASGDSEVASRADQLEVLEPIFQAFCIRLDTGIISIVEYNYSINRTIDTIETAFQKIAAIQDRNSQERNGPGLSR